MTERRSRGEGGLSWSESRQRSRVLQLSCGRRAVMMVARRSRGEGSLFWNEKRQRWIGLVSLGYAASGKRRRHGSAGERRPRQSQAAGGDAGPGRGFRPIAATTPSPSGRGWLAHGLAATGSEHRKEPDDPGTAHLLPAWAASAGGAHRPTRSTVAHRGERHEAEHRHPAPGFTAILRRSIRRAQARDHVQAQRRAAVRRA